MARKKKTEQKPEKLEQTKDAATKQKASEQTTDTAPEQKVPEQTTDPAPETEAAEQTTDPAPDQEPPKDDGQDQEPQEPSQDDEQDKKPPEPPKETGTEPDMFADLPNPCVYCGPSVKGVARQYTTYQGGIPDALREFIKARPEALGLIVSTGKFPAMRRRLETHGTREAKLYKAVKASL